MIQRKRWCVMIQIMIEKLTKLSCRSSSLNPMGYVRPVAINARLRGEDLWMTAQEDVSILCLSPEQLVSKGFVDLLEHSPFWKRFCALGVTSIHLMYMR